MWHPAVSSVLWRDHNVWCGQSWQRLMRCLSQIKANPQEGRQCLWRQLQLQLAPPGSKSVEGQFVSWTLRDSLGTVWGAVCVGELGSCGILITWLHVTWSVVYRNGARDHQFTDCGLESARHCMCTRTVEELSSCHPVIVYMCQCIAAFSRSGAHYVCSAILT